MTGKVVSIGGTKEQMTFRLDPGLVKRLRETAEKSAGRLTMTDVLENALRNSFEVRDAGKLLARLVEQQQTTITETRQHRATVDEVRGNMARHFNDLSQRTTKSAQDMAGSVTQAAHQTEAALRTLQAQMARMEASQRQLENQMTLLAREMAHARLSVPLWIGIAGLWLLGAGGAVWLAMVLKYYWLVYFG